MHQRIEAMEERLGAKDGGNDYSRVLHRLEELERRMDREQEQLDGLNDSIERLKKAISDRVGALQAEIAKQHDQIAELVANGSGTQDSTDKIAAQRKVVDDMITQLIGDLEPAPATEESGSQSSANSSAAPSEGSSESPAQ